LLFVLAAFVACASILTLLGRVEAQPSPIGIVLLGPHWDYALYLAWNGRAADALAENAKCRELDPVQSEPLQAQAFTYYHLKNYEKLIEVSRSFTALWPNRWLAHYWLGVGYEGAGRSLDSIPEYQKAVQLSQGDQDPTAALAHAYAATGRKGEAQKILQDAAVEDQVCLALHDCNGLR
jgi:Flp pilus assembly protein TadD